MASTKIDKKVSINHTALEPSVNANVTVILARSIAIGDGKMCRFIIFSTSAEIPRYTLLFDYFGSCIENYDVEDLKGSGYKFMRNRTGNLQTNANALPAGTYAVFIPF